MSKGIPPRFSFQKALNLEEMKYAGNDLYVDKDGLIVLIDHSNLHPSEIEEGNTWLESDLVPDIMANPQYWMSGKWKKGTNSTGPK
jgi:hypothetical protein